MKTNPTKLITIIAIGILSCSLSACSRKPELEPEAVEQDIAEEPGIVIQAEEEKPPYTALDQEYAFDDSNITVAEPMSYEETIYSLSEHAPEGYSPAESTPKAEMLSEEKPEIVELAQYLCDQYGYTEVTLKAGPIEESPGVIDYDIMLDNDLWYFSYAAGIGKAYAVKETHTEFPEVEPIEGFDAE